MVSIPEEGFHAMAHLERRKLLVTLMVYDSQTDDCLRIPDDLPIAKREQESLQVRMYHNHLPRLEAGGFIRWDRDTQQVTAGPQFDTLRPLLTALQDIPHGDIVHE